MQMDKTELGCLRAIVLFNPGQPSLQLFPVNALGLCGVVDSVLYQRHARPDCGSVFVSDAKGLSNPPEVEGLREKVYASLESYTKQKYPDQPGR